MVRFTHDSKSSQAVGYDMFGGFTAAGRGINETRIGVSGDVYKEKAPQGQYMSYIHLPDTPDTQGLMPSDGKGRCCAQVWQVLIICWACSLVRWNCL
jgi:hypothetical protein